MKKLLIISALAIFGATLYWWGHIDGSSGNATPFIVATAIAQDAPAGEAGGEPPSPVKARDRDTYYPNSEDLKPDEMRVIACGTGMPTTRAAQAAASSNDPDTPNADSKPRIPTRRRTFKKENLPRYLHDKLEQLNESPPSFQPGRHNMSMWGFDPDDPKSIEQLNRDYGY